MRQYIYKVIIAVIAFIFVFEFTIGRKFNQINEKTELFKLDILIKEITSLAIVYRFRIIETCIVLRRRHGNIYLVLRVVFFFVLLSLPFPPLFLRVFFLRRFPPL